MKTIIRTGKIKIDDYKRLRNSVQWPLPPDKAIKKALKNSEFLVSAQVDGKIAGMGRIVSDSGFIYFIADIIVLPEFQARGIGKIIMTSIMDFLKKHMPPNAYITLCSAMGKEKFYEQFGFFTRPNDKYGSGMMIDFNRL